MDSETSKLVAGILGAFMAIGIWLINVNIKLLIGISNKVIEGFDKRIGHLEETHVSKDQMAAGMEKIVSEIKLFNFQNRQK